MIWANELAKLPKFLGVWKKTRTLIHWATFVKLWEIASIYGITLTLQPEHSKSSCPFSLRVSFRMRSAAYTCSRTGYPASVRRLLWPAKQDANLWWHDLAKAFLKHKFAMPPIMSFECANTKQRRGLFASSYIYDQHECFSNKINRISKNRPCNGTSVSSPWRKCWHTQCCKYLW